MKQKIVFRGTTHVAVKVSSQTIFIHQTCYADSKCLETIGKKYNDAGINHTLFYRGEYPNYKTMPSVLIPYDCFEGYPPGVFKRASSTLVWVIVARENYERYIAGKIDKLTYWWW